MEFDEKVQEVQKAFTAERIKRFAIASPKLLKQSDYVKSLYMRMLCALMRCGSPTEEQVLFVQRLTAGAEMTDNFTELMRQSMNMDAESITVFIEALSPNDMKYYFVLDGCITCVLGTGNDRFAMLAECAELLGVTEIELRYLAQAAKAIVLQSSAAFDEAKKYRTARTENLSFGYHIKWFYSGVIENTERCFHWYSANKKKLDLEKCNLNARNIIIENAEIELAQQITLDNHGYVVFRNCSIVQQKYGRITLLFTDEVEFENCTITGATQGDSNRNFCDFDHTAKLTVKHNVFRNCVSPNALFRETNCTNKALNEATVIGNSLVDCRVERDNESALLASIQNCNYLKVLNNSFVGCRYATQGVFVWHYKYIKEKEIRDNKLSGSVTQICNFEA